MYSYSDRISSNVIGQELVAAGSGLRSSKINCVVMRGINEDEVKRVAVE
jgi:molybdenum cofactor biosynthesis enzyme MoaA